MSKRFFLFFVFFLTNVSAYHLSASPEEIAFDGFEGDKTCQTIAVSLDTIMEVVAEDRWASEGISSRTLLLHDKDAIDLGLIVDYKKDFAVIDKRNLEICIRGDSGSYHGLFLFRAKEESAGVGVWAKVNIEKKRFGSMISGNVIKREGNRSIFLLIGLLIVVFVLLFRKLIRARRIQQQDV